MTPSSSDLTSLRDSIGPFVEHFNRHDGKPRVVAVVSPTCGACVAGAVAVDLGVLRAFPSSDVSVSVIWIDMLPDDNASSAASSAQVFVAPSASDARLRQFHDPQRRIGHALAGALELEGPAWDVYLVYPPGRRWADEPPSPADWMHQLGGQGADRDRFQVRDRLVARLQEAMEAVVAGPPARPPPTEAEFQSELAARWRATPQGMADESSTCDDCANMLTGGMCPMPTTPIVTLSRSQSPDGAGTNDVVQLQVFDPKCSTCVLRAATMLLLSPQVRSVDADRTSGVLTVRGVAPGSVAAESLATLVRMSGLEAALKPIK
jgi:hypothetical protein